MRINITNISNFQISTCMFLGHLLAHVSWTCNQSNPDIHVSGYKVLVDSKQYGTTIHAGMKSVKIKVFKCQLTVYLITSYHMSNQLMLKSHNIRIILRSDYAFESTQSTNFSITFI